MLKRKSVIEIQNGDDVIILEDDNVDDEIKKNKKLKTENIVNLIILSFFQI
jgi:hypothetical protein